MPIGEICNREVTFVRRHDTALAAAKLMRQHHVGDVLIVEHRNGAPIPLGIITDRDLVVEVMAAELNPANIMAGDIMAAELATVKENTGVFETLQYMRAKGVRRMPVVDNNGGLAGIVAMDDLLELLSEEFLALSSLVKHEHKKEMVIRH